MKFAEAVRFFFAKKERFTFSKDHRNRLRFYRFFQKLNLHICTVLCTQKKARKMSFASANDNKKWVGPGVHPLT